MNHRAQTPHIALVRAQRHFRGRELGYGDGFRVRICGREAEVGEDDVGVASMAGDGRAEEDVVGFDVAVDDAGPVTGWGIGVSGIVVVAVVEEGEGFGDLGEDAAGWEVSEGDFHGV